MRKYITKFETQTLFDEAKSNLDKPHVSLTVDNNTVHYLGGDVTKVVSFGKSLVGDKYVLTANMSDGKSLPLMINNSFGAVVSQVEEGSITTQFSAISDCSTRPQFYVPVEKVGDGIDCEMYINNCAVGQYGLTGDYAFNINNQTFIVSVSGIIPTGRDISVDLSKAIEL